MKTYLKKLLADWHEAGRAQFEAECPNLEYDDYAKKSVVERIKYICLDEGMSGAFMVEKETGFVYRLKSKYGVPNKTKCVGHVSLITGADLNRLRWW